MSSSDLRFDPLASTIPLGPSPTPAVQDEDDSIVAVSAAAAAAFDNLADDTAVEREPLAESDTGAGSNHSLSRTTLPTPTLPNLSPRSKEAFPELDKLISGSESGSGSNLASSVSRSELQASLEAETSQGSNTDLKDAVQLRAAGHVPGYSPAKTPTSISPLNNSPDLSSPLPPTPSNPIVDVYPDDAEDDNLQGSDSSSSSSSSEESVKNDDNCCHANNSPMPKPAEADPKSDLLPPAPTTPLPPPPTPLPPAPTPLPPAPTPLPPAPSTPLPLSPVTKKTPVRQITSITILEGTVFAVSIMALTFFAVGKGAVVTYFAGPALFSVPFFGITALLSATLLAKNYYPLKV